MNILNIFSKTFKENIRDWKVLILTIGFTPFFVLLMYLFYGSTSVQYNVLVYNADKGAIAENSSISAGKGLISAIKAAVNADGNKIFNIKEVDEISKGKNLIKDKSADIFLVIPEDFSSVINFCTQGKSAKKANIELYGNMTNNRYLIAAVYTDSYINRYVSASTSIELPINYKEEFLETSHLKREFDFYVPALIVISVIMILFTASASIIKEVDKDTIVRLRISKLNTFDFLSGISLVQVIITILSMTISLVTAVMLGYKPSGSIFSVLVIGILASISVTSISLIVSSFLKTIFDLMTIGCFPFFILMFFSGGMFPMPQIKLFNIGNYRFNLTDILPTSHAVSALNKIMNFGSGLSDVVFEIAAMLILTIAYFVIGTVMFKRRYMKAA